jgi:hypothetical protein
MGGCMTADWKVLSRATCGTPGGHVPDHDFLDVRVTIRRRDRRFRVTVTETRGHTQCRDKIYGRCEVVGDSARLDTAIAEVVTRARKAEIEIRCLTRAVAETRDAAIAVLLREKKATPTMCCTEKRKGVCEAVPVLHLPFIRLH